MSTIASKTMPFPADTSCSATPAAPAVALVTPHKATYFKPLLEAFAQAQPAPWRLCVIWPEGHVSEHPQELITPEAANLDIRRVSSGKAAPPAKGNGQAPKRKRFLPSRALWRTLAQANPRAILIQEYSPFTLGALIYARWHHIPVMVLTEVGHGNQHYFKPAVRLWHAWWSLFVQGIGAESPAAREPISRRATPALPVYHAVDSRLYVPALREFEDGAPVTFVYVGQLIPRKGLDLWMNAASELKRRGVDNFKLRIVGGGDETWIRHCVANAGMEQHLEWTGFRSGEALREAINSADVFVLPTRQDTYAVVVHEAACMGLPLLVSQHAGAAQGLVREGDNGYVFDPEDSKSFADHMQCLLDPALRCRMGTAARATAEEYSAHQRGAALWHWMQQQFGLHHG